MPFRVIMPDLGAASADSTLLRWLAAGGELVKQGQALFEAESDKATIEIEAGGSGRLVPLVSPGTAVPAGGVIALLLAPGESYPLEDEEPSKVGLPPYAEVPGVGLASQKQIDRLPGRLIITPLARRLARSGGLNPRTLSGSGPRGRIIAADVRAARASPADAPAVAPITPLRAAIARHMGDSAHTVAPVTLTTEVEAEGLVALRRRLQAELAPHAEWASYDLLLARLAAQALSEFPLLNASWGEAGIIFHPQIHIGVAVDTERGLLVPVLKDVPGRSLAELARDLHEMIDRARDGRSLPEDLAGGTFTITNLGGFGIDAFTPIIHLPECAVLGVGRVRAAPVVRGSELAVGQVLALSLTFDHRLVDGAPAARFLARLSQLVQIADRAVQLR